MRRRGVTKKVCHSEWKIISVMYNMKIVEEYRRRNMGRQRKDMEMKGNSVETITEGGGEIRW